MLPPLFFALCLLLRLSHHTTARRPQDDQGHGRDAPTAGGPRTPRRKRDLTTWRENPGSPPSVGGQEKNLPDLDHQAGLRPGRHGCPAMARPAPSGSVDGRGRARSNSVQRLRGWKRRVNAQIPRPTKPSLARRTVVQSEKTPTFGYGAPHSSAPVASDRPDRCAIVHVRMCRAALRNRRCCRNAASTASRWSRCGQRERPSCNRRSGRS